MSLLDYFPIKERGSDVRTEIIAGVTTFLTLSYIVFVQPAVLSACGMDMGAVMVATCVASAIATILMGLLANYPIALAPAMGHNFYFAFTVCGTSAMGGLGYPWQVALGANFISGSIFVLFSNWGMREKIIEAVPASLRYAIAVGIGFLIALVGLEWGGIIVASPGTLVTLGNLHSPPVIITILGILFIAILLTRQIKGAILFGIIFNTALCLAWGLIRFEGIVSRPPSIAPTFFKLRLADLFSYPQVFTVIFILFFLDLFDTVGTLIGVSEEAHFMEGGKLTHAKQALLSDAIGTVVGALMGTSTITSYIESASGISEGGRTGLANMVTAALLLLSLFFFPLVKMIGGGYRTPLGATLYPVIAPALIMIGVFIIKAVRKIDWEDYSEAIPAFLTLFIMPLTFSVTEGIVWGFISYTLLKVVQGKGKEVNGVLYFLSGIFLVRYILL
ncbi:MAG: NCS2 family permease [Candidatus Schekmanbacteria bacterium]|nr:NCS2 family permease [Candidatus Schekmanbacteria bacterium]